MGLTTPKEKILTSHMFSMFFGRLLHKFLTFGCYCYLTSSPVKPILANFCIESIGSVKKTSKVIFDNQE